MVCCSDSRHVTGCRKVNLIVQFQIPLRFHILKPRKRISVRNYKFPCRVLISVHSLTVTLIIKDEYVRLRTVCVC